MLHFYSSPKQGVSYNAKNCPLIPKSEISRFAFLSNFEPCKNGVTVDGLYGKSSEHVFQALRWRRGPVDESEDVKLRREAYVQAILNAKTGSQCFSLAQYMIPKADGGVYFKAPYPPFYPLRDIATDHYNHGLRHFVDDHEADYDIMYRCVRAKYEQNTGLLAKLKATRSLELVEHTVRDRRWGDGGDGSGLNWLGLILMDVRNQLIGH